jgi:MFS family permease
MLSLAVVMGLGRFAFTPLMPMMLAEGSVDLREASWLASANYLAYLLGALLCTLQPWIWSRLERPPAWSYAAVVRTGLAATTVLTLAMAIQWPASWPTLRFAAGITTALALVFTSSWCLARLARLGAPALGSIIFAGPGLGIVISGLFGSAMVAWHWTAAAGWIVFGLLALVLTAVVWPVFQGGEERLAPLRREVIDGRGAASQVPAAGRAETALLALAYGLAGFGYIITATFLPVIARSAMPASVWLDLFWPIFGTGTVVGALLSARLAPTRDRRHLLGCAYLVQGLGIAIGLWSPTLAGFAVGSLLLGLPFTAISFFAMQEARRLSGGAASSLMGLITATYGVGQVAGPAIVAYLIARSASSAAGFDASLKVAAAALLVGAIIHLWMIRAYPLPAQAPGGGQTARAGSQ